MTDETALYLRVRGEVVHVLGRSAVVGRSRTCDVHLDVQGVSRRHCEVLLRDDGAVVRDLGSSHGTWIDGRRIEGEERLRSGTLVNLGAHGPHIELVNAIVHGRPVLGAPDPPRAPDPPLAPEPRPRTVVAALDRTAETSPARASAPPPTAAPPAGSSFLAGLACGLAAGLAAGAAVAALVDLPL